MNKWMLSIGLMLATASGAHAANLVTNGSFDAPLLTESVNMSKTNMPGWTLDRTGYTSIYLSAADAVAGGDGALYCCGFRAFLYKAADSPDGGAFIANDGDPSYNSHISQTISGLVTGQTYNLSFWYAAAQYTTRSGATTEWWDVKLGSSQSQRTEILHNPSGGFQPWRQATMSFVATGNEAVLDFLAGGTPAGAPPVSLLDGVTLTAAVPEPSSVACFALGIGLLAGLRARRRRA